MLGPCPWLFVLARSLGPLPWLVVWFLHGGEAEDPHQAGGAHPSSRRQVIKSASEKGRSVGAASWRRVVAAQNQRRGAQGCPNVALSELAPAHGTLPKIVELRPFLTHDHSSPLHSLSQELSKEFPHLAVDGIDFLPLSCILVASRTSSVQETIATTCCTRRGYVDPEGHISLQQPVQLFLRLTSQEVTFFLGHGDAF